MLVLLQDAAAGLLPDVSGSLRFGACVLVPLQAPAGGRCQMLMAVRDLECGCWCDGVHSLFAYLGSMCVFN